MTLLGQVTKAVQAYQPLSIKNNASPPRPSSKNEIEVVSFESLMSQSDKRTLASMEDLGKKNGMSEKELERMRVAIAMEKLFSLKEGKGVPDINMQMMSDILEGAGSKRIPLRADFAQQLYDNFDKLRGINIAV